jgi:hypothetical protein
VDGGGCFEVPPLSLPPLFADVIAVKKLLSDGPWVLSLGHSHANVEVVPATSDVANDLRKKPINVLYFVAILLARHMPHSMMHTIKSRRD